MQSKWIYDIVTPQRDFVRYLDSMNKLPVKFVDTRRGRELGNALVPIRIYLPKGDHELPIDGKQASLEIRG